VRASLQINEQTSIKTMKQTVIVLALWGMAHVNMAVAAPPKRPWAKNVSQDTQRRSREAYAAGNQAFAKKSYAIALQHYQRAVALWKHPAIQFNLAQCLMKLGDKPKSYHQLVAAMRYGEAPLGKTLYQKALEQKESLEAQIVRLVVDNRHDDAKVWLDGKLVLSGVGRVAHIIVPGRHQIVAKKARYRTLTVNRVMLPGKRERISIKLERERIYQRRWARWKPWLLVGSGVLVAAAGAGLWAKAQSDYDEFSRELTSLCPAGCEASKLPDSVASARDSGDVFHKLAISAFAVGAATAIAGVALVIVNQPIALEAPLQPMVGPRAAGLSFRCRF
jgi:tetratricopeptide (TPR) repeat protein